MTFSLFTLFVNDLRIAYTWQYYKYQHMRTLILLLFFSSMVMSCSSPKSEINLLIGTYTSEGGGEGIHVYSLNTETGEATFKSTTPATDPSFLAKSSDGKYVYAVSELGNGEGSVAAYQYDESSGKLKEINGQLTQGDHPCHVAIDSRGKHIIVSNYSGGNVSVFPIQSDGGIGTLSQLIQYAGSGPDTDRQNAPHVHAAFFSPDETYVLIQDLGTDRVNTYTYHPDQKDSVLAATEQGYAKAAPGGGPRHLAFSKDGSFVYLVQEMTATLLVYQFEDGKLSPIQEIAINEDNYAGKDGAAHILVSADGKFVYASNRGDANTIAIYQADPQTGKLAKIANQSVIGQGPRHFNISPDGSFLLVANQQSDEVVIFKRDSETGLLQDTGNRIPVSKPVCVVF